jgi:hypothetical protein
MSGDPAQVIFHFLNPMLAKLSDRKSRNFNRASSRAAISLAAVM